MTPETLAVVEDEILIAEVLNGAVAKIREKAHQIHQASSEYTQPLDGMLVAEVFPLQKRKSGRKPNNSIRTIVKTEGDAEPWGVSLEFWSQELGREYNERKFRIYVERDRVDVVAFPKKKTKWRCEGELKEDVLRAALDVLRRPNLRLRVEREDLGWKRIGKTVILKQPLLKLAEEISGLETPLLMAEDFELILASLREEGLKWVRKLESEALLTRGRRVRLRITRKNEFFEIPLVFVRTGGQIEASSFPDVTCQDLSFWFEKRDGERQLRPSLEESYAREKYQKVSQLCQEPNTNWLLEEHRLDGVRLTSTNFPAGEIGDSILDLARRGELLLRKPEKEID